MVTKRVKNGRGKGKKKKVKLLNVGQRVLLVILYQ